MSRNDPLLIWLGITESVRDSISKQHSRETDHNAAMWEWYLHNHHAPSWRHLANALYCALQHTVLEGLKDQVPSLKGELFVLRI